MKKKQKLAKEIEQFIIKAGKLNAKWFNKKLLEIHGKK